MASKWPFMAIKPGENVQVRSLESKPLDFPPPPGFLPEALENPAHCQLKASAGRTPVKVLAINGVPKRDTYLFLRPVTLDKIMAAIKGKK